MTTERRHADIAHGATDRRIREASVITEHRQSARRISPAVGEFAIAEAARLREELLQCRSKLALAAESAAGDDELIAELLAALRAVSAGFVDGSIKWARPRRADSDPYHPANVLMSAAIANASKVQP